MWRGSHKLESVLKMALIFFSYQRDSEPQVQAFYDALKIRGITSIWLDRRNLEPAQMWPDEIEMALKACDYLVLFVTLKALKSDWVQREFQTALATDKKIISVFLEPLELSTVPDALQKIQYLRPYAYEDQAGAIQSLARALAEVREPFILPAMIPVREEPFIYGKPSAAQTLDLAEFWIGQHPVTVIEYSRFAVPTFYPIPDYWPASAPRGWVEPFGEDEDWPPADLAAFANQRPTHPMHGLSLSQAIAYCTWLNKVIGRDGFFHLPSEAQWEKAARGTAGNIYPWGMDWKPGIACTLESNATQPRDCSVAVADGCSPYACQDMAGNIWNGQNPARSRAALNPIHPPLEASI